MSGCLNDGINTRLPINLSSRKAAAAATAPTTSSRTTSKVRIEAIETISAMVAQVMGRVFLEFIKSPL